ncbi:MAG: Gfo/Idh/MocA family oxidoreductase [Isosphaeraceae bacterium]
MASDRISRRGFVGAVGASSAAGAFLANHPAIGRAGVGPADKVRLGIIGAGSRGNQLIDTFFGFPEAEIVAVADVDDQHAGETADKLAKKYGNERPATSRDYRAMLDRKDIDSVIIATPDHWHVIPSIHALQAGKDVYVEKPVGHNVSEGRALIKAARKYNKVCAVGTQQRSSQHFQKAADAVRSGKIGKVFWVQTWNFENISPVGMGNQPDEEAPSTVDYDKWLGPAPKRPFNKNRYHLLFRWFFDYAGGMMSDWGVHLNDIVLWAIDQKGPKSVYSTGGILTTKDNRDTPDTLQVVYTFPNDVVLTYSMRKGNGLPLNGHDYGILFCGTDGSLLLDRAGYEVIPDKISEPYGIRAVYGPREKRTIALEADKVKGDDGQTPHVRDFLDCLKSRKRPICDIEVAHDSTNTCHLGNIAYKLGRTLHWDQATESFINDREANTHLTREYRKGYELPQI